MSEVIFPPQEKRIIFGQELLFDEKEHAYTWGGKFVPGVTSILGCLGKPALVPWAVGLASDHWLSAIKAGRVDYDSIHKESKLAHRKKVQEAANIGHNVHSYAECFFKNKELPTLATDQAKLGAEAFHKWMDAHHVEILASEHRVFSMQYYFAGTCDFVAKVDGVLGIGDIKTSSGIYPEMRFQTAAYQQALQEEKEIKFETRWIVRFDKKTGEFEAKQFNNFDADFTAFNATRIVHKILKEIENGRL